MNSSADLTVLAAATAAEPWQATPPVAPAPGPVSASRELLRAMRPHQAAKNLLLFAALIFAHQLGDGHRMWDTVLGFLAFSLCASSAYLLNDLVDLEADRAHPVKRTRPLAAGRLSPAVASAASAVLAVAAMLAGAAVSIRFLGALLVYLAVTVAYSFRLKRLLLVDVLVLAGLYAWRVMAGAVASDVVLSPWMIQFSIFIFLSIALAKRCAELRRMKLAGVLSAPNTRAYATGDYDQLALCGTVAGYLAVLVLALYL
ncbi:MAG: UbiA family prenyltransferase, partial [Acidobacteria bacterium]|nr:UbiA family prenyltransferase [Acidobacteriota bacterium]